MKLKNEFVCTQVADEIIAVPTGENAGKLHLVLKLNEESRFILESLNQNTTEEEIVNKMEAEYDVDKATLESCVHDFIEELKKADLIE